MVSSSSGARICVSAVQLGPGIQQRLRRGKGRQGSNRMVAFRNGHGVAKDDIAATEWYRRAAEQGFASAQFNLGQAFSNGYGVAKDDKAATEWWRSGTVTGWQRTT